MPALTNPMNALVSLQRALRRGEVRMQRCELHPEMQVFMDRPGGELRLTYAVIDHGRLRACVLMVQASPVEGIACFGIGYAVAEKFRGRGLGGETVSKAIEELRHGLRRNGVESFYIEAIVGRDNEASNRLARRVISDAPVESTDQFSGEPVFQYLKRVE